MRRYDSADTGCRLTKSIRLFANNPNKTEALRKYFRTHFSCKAMPAVSRFVWTLTEERKRAGLAGRKYLKGLRFKSAERRKRD